MAPSTAYTVRVEHIVLSCCHILFCTHALSDQHMQSLGSTIILHRDRWPLAYNVVVNVSTTPTPNTQTTSTQHHLFGACTMGATHSVIPHVRTLTSVKTRLASSPVSGVGSKFGDPSTSMDTEKIPMPLGLFIHFLNTSNAREGYVTSRGILVLYNPEAWFGLALFATRFLFGSWTVPSLDTSHPVPTLTYDLIFSNVVSGRYIYTHDVP
mmetsp:Transcript_10358/g.15240  ORF Transcript_10358/g.15240 Transcript_10358/m.15240 type:complete len:210 (+) Transcript_10358:50-679(+)